MQIDIRLVRPEDAAQIIEYAKIVGAETDCLILDENGMPRLTIEKEADFLRQLPTEHSAMYGAFCGTLPIGIANMQGSNRERIAHRASIGISVRRDYWRQGIGSRLMEALITFAERSPALPNWSWRCAGTTPLPLHCTASLASAYTERWTVLSKLTASAVALTICCCN